MLSDGYMPALVAVLEIPGIIVGLLLARKSDGGGIGKAFHEVIIDAGFVQRLVEEALVSRRQRTVLVALLFTLPTVSTSARNRT